MNKGRWHHSWRGGGGLRHSSRTWNKMTVKPLIIVYVSSSAHNQTWCHQSSLVIPHPSTPAGTFEVRHLSFLFWTSSTAVSCQVTEHRSRCNTKQTNNASRRCKKHKAIVEMHYNRSHQMLVWHLMVKCGLTLTRVCTILTSFILVSTEGTTKVLVIFYMLFFAISLISLGTEPHPTSVTGLYATNQRYTFKWRLMISLYFGNQWWLLAAS